MKILRLTLILMLCAVVLGGFAQKKETKLDTYAVGFYNLENLFDTCHDEGKNDYDFLPSGSYQWTETKYLHKLKNMAQTLSEMGTDETTDGCAFIGVAEVENSRCLEDLVAQEPLSKRGFRFEHIEGPDNRGIDCAFLYNPAYFKVRCTRLVPYVQELEKDSAFFTRGFLTVDGEMAGEHVTVVVCHWPSRFSESFYRESAGRQVRALKDSLLRDNPNVKVFVMGDMNDDPTDKSMTEELRARAEIEDVEAGDMYNPWYNVLVKDGTGTLSYRGAWNLFDQIVMTPNLLKADSNDILELRFWKNQIFRREYLFQTEGKYQGTPKRTHAGGKWLDGYSDHLPVVVYLLKEQK